MIDDSRRDEMAQTVQAFQREQSEGHRQSVVDLLESEDEYVRSKTLGVLVSDAVDPATLEQVFPEVVLLATDPDMDVRLEAKRVITTVADWCADRERPLPELSTLLTHDDVDVRRDALHGANVAGQHQPSVLTNELSRFTDLLSDSNPEVQHLAAVALGHAADVDPATVADAAPKLLRHLETDDALVKGSAAWAIARLSEYRPRSVVPAVPTVRSEIVAEVVETGPLVEILANLARERPESVLDAVPELVELASTSGGGTHLSDDVVSPLVAQLNERRLKRASVRTTALTALTALTSSAEYNAGQVSPHVDEVTPLLTAEVPKIREQSLRLLSVVGTERPQTIESIVPDLITRFEDAREDSERKRVHGVLTELSETSPSKFAHAAKYRLDRLRAMLSSDNPGVRAAAAGFLSYVAEYDPDAVLALDETLVELLDDDDALVRGNAALALGTCGSNQARDALATLDPTEDLIEDVVELALERLDE